MDSQVRTFLAVNLSQNVRNVIEKMLRGVRARIQGTKWVEPHNLHVTLKFFGNIAVNDVPVLSEAIRDVASRTKAFDLEFHGYGAFPNLSAPKTLWIGCREGTVPLQELVGKLETAFEELGYPREKRAFSPHLTIGRVKSNELSNHALQKVFEQYRSFEFGVTDIAELVLYASELTSQGPVYTKLASVPLS